jgi:hydrogenase/urease accessory protein HupE
VSDATVFVRFRDGRTLSHLLTVAAPTWEVPDRESPLGVAKSFVRAGVLHIARGADHLLFLALLVLVLQKPRAVLLAETAFTVSHSLAFTVTALGWLRLRPAPVEACIALSLVLLALEVRGRARASAARGAAAALVFGLVHGLGFAGGLREAGLPDGHAAAALLGFGTGVEIGQVVFLVLVLLVASLLSRLRAFRRLVSASATLIGGLATAWLIERVIQSFTA